MMITSRDALSSESARATARMVIARMVIARTGIALMLALLPLARPAADSARAAATIATRMLQPTFESPARAVETLIRAVRADDAAQMRRILGPGSPPLIESGDVVADRAARTGFLRAYDTAHRIENKDAGTAVLIVGAEQWPLPIPIVRERSGWRFDAIAGEREVLDRRIGRNELAVIEVCREYVKAQREYAALQGSGAQPRAAPEYARHIMSRHGRRDGLYWPAAPGEAESPLGPLIAQARSAGYDPDRPRSGARPYHGYYFRILTAQGQHAPGGARSYISNDRMTGGFALLAYPATYGNSGVMTFIVDQDGIVFERDLGSHTAVIARQISSFDPDAAWRAAP